MKSYDIIYTVKIRETEDSEALFTDVINISAECEYDAIELFRDNLAILHGVRVSDVVILWTHITDVSDYPDPDEETWDWDKAPSPSKLATFIEVQERLGSLTYSNDAFFVTQHDID